MYELNKNDVNTNTLINIDPTNNNYMYVLYLI